MGMQIISSTNIQFIIFISLLIKDYNQTAEVMNHSGLNVQYGRAMLAHANSMTSPAQGCAFKKSLTSGDQIHISDFIKQSNHDTIYASTIIRHI